MAVKQILLPDGEQRRLVFYLAMEEYVAAHREIGEAMFFWKVPPTVIFGRNQVMSTEVNIDWCRKHGVSMYRRKSGGGCVYSDLGNLMISYVSSDTDVVKVFGGYLEMLAGALRGLGVNAEVSGRNDVLIDGGKVSGNAFQLLGDRSIVHGTLLYDTDFAALSQAITPSQNKVQSKGVSSVRQRVTNLKPCLEEAWRDGDPNVHSIIEYIGEKSDPLAFCPVSDMDSLAEYLAKQLCDSVFVLDEAAIAEISEIEKTYLDPSFIAGHEADESVIRQSYVHGVGQLLAEISIVSGRIGKVHLSGDYFAAKLPGEIDNILSDSLMGIAPDRKSIMDSLSGIALSEIIPGLRIEDLTNLFLDE